MVVDEYAEKGKDDKPKSQYPGKAFLLPLEK
jgi:hypothetical protein